MILTHTYTMDPEKLREYLETHCVLDSATGRCVHRVLGKTYRHGSLPVHLYASTDDVDRILELATVRVYIDLMKYPPRTAQNILSKETAGRLAP